MKATYHSLQTSNETVAVKNAEPILMVEPSSGKLTHGGYSEELHVQFNNYLLTTDDETVIKYMDNPKHGLGSAWIKLEEPDKKDKK